jgi:hypothetical protein
MKRYILIFSLLALTSCLKEQDCCRHHRDKCYDLHCEAFDTATAMAISGENYSYSSDDEIKDSESKNTPRQKANYPPGLIDAHCHFMVWTKSSGSRFAW